MESLSLAAYRGELALASLCVLLLPYLLWHFYPGYVNPLGARLVFCVVPLLIIGGTYLSQWVREHVWLITCSYAYPLTAYVAWLADINHFNYLTGVSVCVAVVGTGLALSMHADRAGRLALYLAGLLVITIAPLTFPGPTPSARFFLYCVYFALIVIVLYLAGVARLRIMKAVKQSRAEVAEQEQLLRTVLDTIPDPIFIIDRAGHYQMTNEAGTEGTRVNNPSEVVGKTAHDLFPPETAENVHRADMELMEKGEDLYGFEHTFETPDGEERTISSTRVLLRDEDGTVNGLVGIAHDVTEQKKREHELAEQKRLLRTIIDTIPDAIFLLDREGRFQIVNQAGLPPGKTDPAEVTGQTVFEGFPDAAAARLYEEDQQIMESGEGVYDKEYDVQTLGGEPRILSATKIPFRDESGEIVGLVGTTRDVTERKARERALRAAKEEAEAAARAKSQILNNMSHELRTPLTTILGFAEVLEEESEEEQAEFAGRIARSGKRLQQTLDSVLDLAQLESGSKQLQFRPVDVAKLTREVVRDTFSPLAQEKGLRLHLEMPDAHANATAPLDENALHRILSNLLSNAIKFTEEGHVIVGVEGAKPGAKAPETGGVRLWVEDTGIGISEDFQAHLFEDFQQESTGLSRSHEGSGLGLAITRRLVELMNGTISVESTKGEGTRFTVVFPHGPGSNGVQATAATPASREASSAEGDDACKQSQRKVLVVEDNADTRRLAEHLLRHECSSVETVTGFDAAVTIAQRHAREDTEAGDAPFDLLLLDIDLGEEREGDAPRDGIHLLRILRREAGCAEVPAVALTAYAMPGDQARFLEAGFDAYLAKPFTRSELAQVVEEASRVKCDA